RLVRRVCRLQHCSPRSIGGREVPLFTDLADVERGALQSVSLPLPSARLHLDEHPLKSLYDEALKAEGIELRQLRVKYPRDSFFSKGERAAVFQPADLADTAADDELYAGRQKLTLNFTLPRAAYATIVIKRIFPGTAD